MLTQQITGQLRSTSRRVELSTDPKINDEIKRRSDQQVRRLAAASPAELSRRIGELGEEWDVERRLQLNASTLALTGTILGFTKDHRFFLIPTLVFSFFLQHALQGWCPPIPVFRRLGVRTQREIERERYALKLLRGDFDADLAGESDARARVDRVLQAVDLD